MTVRRAPQSRRPQSGTDMSAQVTELAAEAERQFRDGLLEFAAQDAVLARTTAEGLAQAVGTAAEQERLAVIDRLEHLREALAVLAIGIARTHGQLAWFLARASTVLTPVLRWRSLPADRRQSFGTVVPDADELGDAEGAVRRLCSALTRIGTAGVGPQPGPETSPDSRAAGGPAPDGPARTAWPRTPSPDPVRGRRALGASGPADSEPGWRAPAEPSDHRRLGREAHHDHA
ncbi:hypothetical protein [Streptomyces sp. CBMA123]|uniref:hypothetical protein n=1 Tax=Streptomyces sp. CBMA123 TaxID=1896313 RepID=UPI001661CC48|nr:hypothetical protein [Streptomyces sp. CBMA123]MBD0693708.1 hypothetical protein [Streptomyces sp. CBMA123]